MNERRAIELCLRFTTSFVSAGAAELLAFGTAVVVENAE